MTFSHTCTIWPLAAATKDFPARTATVRGSAESPSVWMQTSLRLSHTCSRIVSATLWVCRVRTLTVQSTLDEYKKFCDAESASTSAVWPVNVRTQCRESVSQTLMVMSYGARMSDGYMQARHRSERTLLPEYSSDSHTARVNTVALWPSSAPIFVSLAVSQACTGAH